MSKNFIAPGDMLPLVAPYNVVSGQGFQVGNIFAVAQTTALAGAAVQGHVEGVYDLAKAPGVVITQGARVFWDNTNMVVTNLATGNSIIGVAVNNAAAGDALVRVDVLHALTGADPVRAVIASIVPQAAGTTAFTLPLPKGHILAVHERTTVAFTGATVTLQLGTTPGAADIVAATDIHAIGANALALVNASIANASPFAGGTLYGTITQTTPTNVGAGVFIVTYIPLS